MLQRRPDDFAERNLLLLVALGLQSAGSTFDALLARHAPPELAADPDDDDSLVFALLGAVALRETLRAHLDAVPEPAPPAPRADVGPPTELLR